MAGKYASETSVSVEKSRAEIEATLAKYGADAFAYSIDGRYVRLAFRMLERHYRFGLTLPDKAADEFNLYKRGSAQYRREPHTALAAWEQACRSIWRALALVIKAKLEAVAAGISTVEDEFLAHMVLPNSETVSEWIKPQVADVYRVGQMPRQLMLSGPSDG